MIRPSAWLTALTLSLSPALANAGDPQVGSGTGDKTHAEAENVTHSGIHSATTGTAAPIRQSHDKHAKTMIKLFKEDPQIRAVMLEQSRSAAQSRQPTATTDDAGGVLAALPQE